MVEDLLQQDVNDGVVCLQNRWTRIEKKTKYFVLQGACIRLLQMHKNRDEVCRNIAGAIT